MLCFGYNSMLATRQYGVKLSNHNIFDDLKLDLIFKPYFNFVGNRSISLIVNSQPVANFLNWLLPLFGQAPFNYIKLLSIICYSLWKKINRNRKKSI